MVKREKQRVIWSLGGGFEEHGKPYRLWNVSPDFRKAREYEPPCYPCTDISKMLGFESDIPAEERGENIITPQTSFVLYNEALLRKEGCLPVMVSMKHAGHLIPDILWKRIKYPDALSIVIDNGTTFIFQPDEGSGNARWPAVRHRINRGIVDANRDPTDFQGKFPSFRGVVWLKDTEGKEIFKSGKAPTKDEIRQLVDDLYNPFYRALHAMAGSLYDEKGFDEILYIDGHSFPGDIDFEEYKVNAKDPKPLILVGTGGDPWQQGKLKKGIPRYGADKEIVDLFIQVLKDNIPDELIEDNPLLNEKVALNQWWTGTKNIKDFGKKPARLTRGGHVSQAIQVEMNEAAYFDGERYNREALAILRKAMDKAIEAAGTKMLELNER